VEVRELRSSPGMLPLFARAGAALIPGASHLPWVGGGASEVPELTLVLDDVAVDRDRLAAYDRVCGFDFGDTLPATYPHMLAFPLHLALMTDGRFPFPAIGLVHIYNRIVQHRPLRSSEPISLRVWSSPLQPHPRGTQFSIHSEARVADELVWEEVSTNLRRGSRGAAEDAPAPEVPSAEELPVTATWSLPGDLGRRYGSVSGDLNPIHVHPLSARLFGFPSAIAHGMWTAARCLAALEPRLPEAFAVEVAFRKPILLPARVDFVQATTKAGMRFGVRGTRKPTAHLDGELTAKF
jgi:acyl dehydratase